jgi:hypothetical protein
VNHRRRYGSAELIADLGRFGPTILECCRLTYPQMLAALQATGAE